MILDDVDKSNQKRKYKFVKHLYKDNFEFIIQANDEEIIEELEQFISFDKMPRFNGEYDTTTISFIDKSNFPEDAKHKIIQGERIVIHGGTPEQHVWGTKVSVDNKKYYNIPKNDEYIIQNGNQYYLYGGNQGKEENLYRIVREIYYRKSLALGRVAIHSAAVADEKGRCILIPGEKATGKTTFLCNLLASKKYKFLDNDRILLELDNQGGLKAHSMSSTVNVGFGTMRIVPDKFRDIKISGYEKPTDKKRYTRKGFIKQMSCDSTTTGKVKSIVFPKIKKESHVQLRKCNREEKMHRIGDAIERYDNSEHPDWLGISNVSEEQYRINILKILQYIEKNIPAHEMQFGYERINDNELCQIDERGE